MIKVENIKYGFNYTLNTYKDFLLTGPLFLTEKLYGLAGIVAEAATGKRPDSTNWDKVKEFTPSYKKREEMRKEWDTRPGVDLINSNLVGMIAFLGAGATVAELTYSGLEKIIPQDSQLIREATTSLATAIAGYIAGNGTVISDIVFRTQKDYHRKENGNVDWNKAKKTSIEFLKTALGFDIPFFGGKAIMQTLMINKGMDPAPASAVYDLAGIFGWYCYLIPAYTRKGIIRPKSKPEGFGIPTNIEAAN